MSATENATVTSPITLTPADLESIVDALSIKLRKFYILGEDLANQIINVLTTHLKDGTYTPLLSTPTLLAESLTNDLRSINNDKHLSVSFSENVLRRKEDPALQNMMRRMRRNRIRPLRLWRNRCLPAAFKLIENTQVLIIDVRDAIGGDDQGSKYVNKPVYVLTNDQTFSACEKFAVCIQAINRAKIVGTTTAGEVTLAHSSAPAMTTSAHPSQLERHMPCNRERMGGCCCIPDIAVSGDIDPLHVAHLDAARMVMSRCGGGGQGEDGGGVGGKVMEKEKEVVVPAVVDDKQYGLRQSLKVAENIFGSGDYEEEKKKVTEE
ncbi:ClpP/crotonase-like domain-containing protein [Chytridium lagenaria]|nr:ClpP/crotonase-like domain-containing protein [Chytridium lagenaria]